jgi:hypothetical protein
MSFELRNYEDILIGEIPEPLAPDLYGKVFFLNSLVFLESM